MSAQYDNVIGYSDLENVDIEKMAQLITGNKKLIEQYFSGSDNSIILVAGAGSGEEAHQIRSQFGLPTIGVDINIARDNVLSSDMGRFSLSTQDISKLALCRSTFSLVYCYHVLEHVDDPVSVLYEFERVLKRDGVLFIGFPNKNRLLSYFGTSQKASLLEKIKWNIQDYHYRLMGKFENKYGAHAGFSEQEFLMMAQSIFSLVYVVRNEYMQIKYSRFRWLINFIVKFNLAEFLFPSNYFVCVKKD